MFLSHLLNHLRSTAFFFFFTVFLFYFTLLFWSLLLPLFIRSALHSVLLYFLFSVRFRLGFP
jgi:hypothetical protein